MPKLPVLSAKDVIKILTRAGFHRSRQKGSHVTITNGLIYVTVPLKEIRIGLLRVILRDCGIPREDFLKQL
ncbi:MAG: type II toxin-antitoxin system HicA family toxin [Thaumarchaeota archaeon]|nr:type II toxin-antitoxin system HicA family toxin [Nitrososphaerota archaeon]